MSTLNEKDILEKLEALLAINESLVLENKEKQKKIDSMTASNVGGYVDVSCNLIMGAQLTSPSGDIDIEVKYGEVITLSDEDIRILLKNSTNRDMFTNCLVFFVDESNYNKFGIRRRVNICDDVIVETIKNGTEESVCKYFDECTSKKFEPTVMNTLFYKIVILNLDGKFGNLPYGIRKAIEKYFNMELEMATKLYTDFKKLF